MRILFTGGSSLTGMWFIKELAEAGHFVVATFRQSLESYKDLRRLRIEKLLSYCEPVFECPFGSDKFQHTISKENHWDLFCHHAADVSNYKSPDFDAVSALAGNTKNLKTVLNLFLDAGCRDVLLTGSVFEQGEGAGTDGLRAVSPYGLSKGLTSEVFKFYTSILNMNLSKFVIPNPFGPFEEERFTTYLIKNWVQGNTAAISSPDYVRDNVPVSLLAKAYVNFAENCFHFLSYKKTNPSFYLESQGRFTQRFAEEMRARLELPCEYELKTQIDFTEPRTRVNTDLLDGQKLGWDEKQAWDQLAQYYQNTYQGCFRT